MTTRALVGVVILILSCAASIGMWKAQLGPTKVDQVDLDEVQRYEAAIADLIAERNGFLIYLARRYHLDPEQVRFDLKQGAFVPREKK